MESNEVRESFLRFFEQRDHLRLPSWPLVPYGDPTLLFTSAGMVQFKRYFMGESEPPGRRFTTVQKCFRTSDIDSVGDSSHLTFFEMLGNFSVGDYFKPDVIPWAWDYVTNVLKLPKERLWAAVYLDDDEAYELWKQQGVPEQRIMRYGEESNYWFSGPVGPCGPCSEIHYDFGPTPGCAECAAGTCHPEVECGRFLEIWNLVFMAFYQQEDGSRTPLPQRNIDTGAGLERLTVVTIHNETGRRLSVYETDLFLPMVQRIEQLSGKIYGWDVETDRAIRIVAEHARASAFLIVDGVIPSNEGRGYVLRRILRRAVYFGQSLDLEPGALLEIESTVIEKMDGQYPELIAQKDLIMRVVQSEEEKFRSAVQTGTQILQAQVFAPRTWFAHANQNLINDLQSALASAGEAANWPNIVDRITRWRRNDLSVAIPEEYTLYSLPLWEATMDALTGDLPVSEVMSNPSYLPENERVPLVRNLIDCVRSWQSIVTGREVFILSDTHGVPKELTSEIAEEHGFTIDLEGFERLMEEQRERARAAARFNSNITMEHGHAHENGETHFVGYDTLRLDSEVIAISKAGTEAQSAQTGEEIDIVLRETPFYPEGGGQVGDVGEIAGPNGRVTVRDTQRVSERLITHYGRVVEGSIAVGDTVTAQVDVEHRYNVMRNHTATHLMHAALRQVLGSHVRQAGSLVASDRLRFDFSHMEPMKPEEIAEVQRLVNEKIRADLPVRTRETSFRKAMDEGVIAFFEEKYGEHVRVVEALENGHKFSSELCGGTHCSATGQIGSLIITSESGIGAGMRRIEAVTGRGAEEYVRKNLELLQSLAQRVGTSPDRVPTRIDSLLSDLEAKERQIESLERQRTRDSVEDYLAQLQEIDGVRVIASATDATNIKFLREIGDMLKSRLAERAVIVLSAVTDGEPKFVTLVSQDMVERGLKAGEILSQVAAMTGGSGGGRPDMAQGGGKDVGRVAEALREVPQLVRQKLLGSP